MKNINKMNMNIKKIILDIVLVFGLLIGGTMIMSANNINKDDIKMKENIELVAKQPILHADMKSMKRALGLRNDQLDAVEYEMTCLEDKLKSINEDHNVVSDQMMSRMLWWVFENNARMMKHVLDEKQYKWYLVLLNTTINNRGLVLIEP